MKYTLTIGLLAALLAAGPALAGTGHDHDASSDHDHAADAPETKAFYGSGAEGRMETDQGSAPNSNKADSDGAADHRHGPDQDHDH